jgi:hypothetical protein
MLPLYVKWHRNWWECKERVNVFLNYTCALSSLDVSATRYKIFHVHTLSLSWHKAFHKIPTQKLIEFSGNNAMAPHHPTRFSCPYCCLPTWISKSVLSACLFLQAIVSAQYLKHTLAMPFYVSCVDQAPVVQKKFCH